MSCWKLIRTHLVKEYNIFYEIDSLITALVTCQLSGAQSNWIFKKFKFNWIPNRELILESCWAVTQCMHWSIFRAVHTSAFACASLKIHKGIFSASSFRKLSRSRISFSSHVALREKFQNSLGDNFTCKQVKSPCADINFCVPQNYL